MEYQIESWIDGGSMVILFCWWSKTSWKFSLLLKFIFIYLSHLVGFVLHATNKCSKGCVQIYDG